MNGGYIPEGWDEAKVRRVLEHYDNQTDEEAAAEDEAYFNDPQYRLLRVPKELVTEVKSLIAEFEARRAS
ncbi:MAG: hypothetical protein WD557_02855 [Dehalococcoidia bacterium]